MITAADIEAAKNEKGAFTKKSLATLGVPWPPPKGWKEALLDGKTLKEAGLRYLEPSVVIPAVSANELLRIVVLAVVEAGHASDLYEFPEVLAHFGARIPDDDELMAQRMGYVTGNDDGEN